MIPMKFSYPLPFDAVTSEDVAQKYEAWNWRVITIDGNNADDIRNALKAARSEKESPPLLSVRPSWVLEP